MPEYSGIIITGSKAGKQFSHHLPRVQFIKHPGLVPTDFRILEERTDSAKFETESYRHMVLYVNHDTGEHMSVWVPEDKGAHCIEWVIRQLFEHYIKTAGRVP